METLSVSKFKATCLSVLEQVKTKRKKVRITKRGVPIAEIVPVNGVNGKEKKASLKGCVTFIGDIVSPVAEDEWEVQK
jgi:prevent-host-death family protein